MAASIETCKAKYHVRSTSLPSRCHPRAASAEEQLQRLSASEATSSSSPCQRLDDLKNLYDTLDDLLQLPLTRQSLSNEQDRECIEQVLGGSLRLLDVCSTTRDVFSQIKESLQGIESSLRRRRGEFGLANEMEAYMVCRKKLNKVVSKRIKNLKRMEKSCPSTFLDKNSNLAAVVGMLRDAEDIGFAMFETVLSFVSQPKTTSRSTGWLLFSKRVQSKPVSSKGEIFANEVEKIDAELLVLKSSKKNNVSQMQNVLKAMEALELSIKGVEDELECVYRQLVKTRVSLLNILNH